MLVRRTATPRATPPLAAGIVPHTPACEREAQGEDETAGTREECPALFLNREWPGVPERVAQRVSRRGVSLCRNAVRFRAAAARVAQTHGFSASQLSGSEAAAGRGEGPLVRRAARSGSDGAAHEGPDGAVPARAGTGSNGVVHMVKLFAATRTPLRLWRADCARTDSCRRRAPPPRRGRCRRAAHDRGRRVPRVGAAGAARGWPRSPRRHRDRAHDLLLGHARAACGRGGTRRLGSQPARGTVSQRDAAR
jgi:hypothetical protein